MPFLVMDLEMTGPDPAYHDIIQVGAVLYDNQWNEKSQYLTNVYPQNEEAFSIMAEQVHGLSRESLKDAPMIYDVIPEFEKWIRDTLGRKTPTNEFAKSRNLRDIIMCGQSVINDINFLKFAYLDEKLDWPYSYKLLDLHTLSYFVYKILKNNGEWVPKSLSLDATSKFFGFEREGDQHNALEDAILTAKCFKEFFKISKEVIIPPVEE